MGAPPFVAERFAFGEIIPSTRIDREKGIIRGVRILNAESRNGRVYPESVSKQAASMYARPSYIGHHYDPRTMLPIEAPPTALFGRHMNPRPEAGGLVSDFQFNPEHEFAKPFLWNVANDPNALCFSQLARVQWRPKRDEQGRLVAESILEVASVDIVSEGGTTSGIFESFNRNLNKWVAEMAEAVNAADVAGSLESEGAVLAFLTDFFPALKDKVKEQSTKDAILAMVNAALSGAAPEPPADGASPDDMAPAMEFLRRVGGKLGKWATGKLDGYFTKEAIERHEKWANELIKTEQVAESLVTPLFISMVAESFGNEKRAKELIADRKQLSPPPAGGGSRGGGERGTGRTIAQLVDGFVVG